MSLRADDHRHEPAASRWGAATRRQALARVGRLSLVLVPVGLCVLAAGCGGGSHPGVASLGAATTTTSEPSPAPSLNKVNPADVALAFVSCMRKHGEPNMPEPNIDKSGNHVSIGINVGAGIDPNSPLFAAATNACKHLLPHDGVPTGGQTITPADQADYLKGAVCMRAHGFPTFPDPTFQNNSVAFNTHTPIDTNSAQFQRALKTCQKLIPAGLPYSSSSGP